MKVTESQLAQWSGTLAEALRRGTKRPHGNRAQEDETARRFASGIEARMAEGNELIAWDDAEHYRALPEERVLEAVRELATHDVVRLVNQLSASDDVLATYTFTRFLPWGDKLGALWLGACGSSRMAALGLVRWLRWIAEQTRRAPLERQRSAIAAELDAVADALRLRPRSEEVDLWWQALGMVYRLCPRVTGGVSPFYSVLNEVAAKSLGRNGGADAMPEEERIRRRELTGNRLVRGVLPHIAASAGPEQRQRLVEIFLADVVQRLEGEQHEMPDVEEQGGLFYVNACGLAIESEFAAGRGLSWWNGKEAQYCSALEGWKGDPSAVGMERAAWLGCAGCIAAIRMAGAGKEWSPIASAVFDLARGNLEDWMWELGTPASARKAFPQLLVKVANLEQPLDGAKVLAFAREVHDAGVLKGVLDLVGGRLGGTDLTELRRLAEERATYEAALGA